MAKTIVKEWFGSSNDSKKATFKEFPTKKAADKYIEKERRHNGREIMGAASFYEIFKKS